MDLVLYVLVFGMIGLINVSKNGGFTIQERSELADSIDNIEVSNEVNGMEVGSNPYCNYNPKAFCKIVEQLGLM